MCSLFLLSLFVFLIGKPDNVHGCSGGIAFVVYPDRCFFVIYKLCLHYQSADEALGSKPRFSAWWSDMGFDFKVHRLNRSSSHIDYYAAETWKTVLRQYARKYFPAVDRFPDSGYSQFYLFSVGRIQGQTGRKPTVHLVFGYPAAAERTVYLSVSDNE